MTSYISLLLLLGAAVGCAGGATAIENHFPNDVPVMVALILEDKSAFILPQFLGAIERLSYPKEKITLWIRVDENSETSKKIVNQWTNKVREFYQSVNYELSSKQGESNHFLALKQEALETASAKDHRYVLFLECDIMLKDIDLIDHLIDASVKYRALVVAPLLNVYGKKYSNFWGGLSEDGTYEANDDYDSIAERKVLGCFDVPMVHTAFLVDVDNIHFDDLSFNSSSYVDNETNKYHNMVGFSRSAVSRGGRMVVCNKVEYGETTLPIHWLEEGTEGKRHNFNVALRRLALDLSPILPSRYLKTEPSTFSKDFDMIYIINLKKRKERRAFMEQIMYELRVENYTMFDAIDGRLLNDTYLSEHNVKVVEGYEEPSTDRLHMTEGEIGCFFSHYSIWKEALAKGYKTVLILEDDASPAHKMLEKYDLVREELKKMQGQWDLLYLGRKLLSNQQTTSIEDFEFLVKPGYSYWLVAYALTNRGIQKILSHKPLSKMMPADEYMPILYNKHPNEQWKSQFSPRDLVALSTQPRLMFPSHYPGDSGYLSDTEHIESGRHDEL